MGLRLIINADDMGMTPGVTQGVIECMTHGIVSSATLMMNMPSAQEAVAMAIKHRLAVGIHLNLTTGSPVLPPSKVRSLVQANGSFYTHDEFVRRLLRWRISTRDIYQELSAQVEMALHRGIQPTHLDTHHHTHLWFPVAWVMMQIGRKYNIRKIRTTRTADMAMRSTNAPITMRVWAKRRYKALVAALLRTRFHMATWRMEPSAFRTVHKYNSGSELEEWLFFVRQLQQLPGNTVIEVPCHPARVDDELRGYAKYVSGREGEIMALTSQELKTAVSQAGIEVISFRYL